MFNFLCYLIHLVSYHFIITLLVAVIIFLSFLSLQYKKIISFELNLFWRRFITVGFVILLANLFVGGLINAFLIHCVGKKGTARIVASYQAGALINYKQVIRYEILLTTGEGKTIRTYFDSDDFNVYPLSVQFPPSPVGSFNVSYIEHFPSAFIITN